MCGSFLPERIWLEHEGYPKVDCHRYEVIKPVDQSFLAQVDQLVLNMSYPPWLQVEVGANAGTGLSHSGGPGLCGRHKRLHQQAIRKTIFAYLCCFIQHDLGRTKSCRYDFDIRIGEGRDS